MENFRIKKGLDLESQSAATGEISLVGGNIVIDDGSVKTIVKEKNYIDYKFRNFEQYADEAAITTTTGITVTGLGCSVETDNAISGSKSLQLVTTSNSGDNVAFDITISDNFDYGKPLYFGLKTRGGVAYTADTSYVANEMYAVITEDGTELAHTIVYIPAGDYQVKGFFIPTSGKAYKLKIKNNITTAGHALLIDDLSVNTQEPIYANSITDWQSYTVGVSGTVSGSYTSGYPLAYYRQVGGSIEISIQVRANNAGSGATALGFSLPSGFTIDSTKVPFINGGDGAFGYASVFNGTSYDSAIVVSKSGSTTEIAILQPGTNEFYTGADWITNSQWAINATIPVVGKSSNIQLGSQPLVEYASNSGLSDSNDTSSFVYGSAGSQIQNASLTADRLRRVRFQTPIKSTDKIEIEISDGNGVWSGLPGFAPTNITIPSYHEDPAGTATAGIGNGFIRVNSTDVDVVVGKYRLFASSSGTNWSSVTNGGLWRLKKTSTGGYPGLPLSARNIIGDTSGATVPAQFIGEKISGSFTNGANIGASNTPYNASSISLTPGVWMIYGKVVHSAPGTSFSYGTASISTTSATHDEASKFRVTDTSVIAKFIGYSVRNLLLSSTTTVYLCSDSVYTGTTPIIVATNSDFFAIRIA